MFETLAIRLLQPKVFRGRQKLFAKKFYCGTALKKANLHIRIFSPMNPSLGFYSTNVVIWVFRIMQFYSSRYLHLSSKW